MDTVELKCSIHNIHHQVDTERFSMDWIAFNHLAKRGPVSNSANGNICVKDIKTEKLFSL